MIEPFRKYILRVVHPLAILKFPARHRLDDFFRGPSDIVRNAGFIAHFNDPIPLGVRRRIEEPLLDDRIDKCFFAENDKHVRAQVGIDRIDLDNMRFLDVKAEIGLDPSFEFSPGTSRSPSLYDISIL